MTPEAARQLVLVEGLGLSGIPVCIRMGDDPGDDRLSRVAEAIDVLISETRSEVKLDRQLTLALWCIGYHGEVQSLSWQKDGSWRDGRFFEQIWGIATKVEEFLLGDVEIPEGKYDTLP